MEGLNLDLKDKKILFELDKNGRIGLPELSKKVRLSKEVVFHRINNLIKKEIILRFQTVISTYRFGYQVFKLYFKLQNMDAKTKKELHSFLMENNYVTWIGYCQGKWDLIIACWVKNVIDFANFQDDLMNKFSNHIHEKEFTVHRKSMQYNRRWFYYDKIDPVETDFGEELTPITIDKKDSEILKILATNARIKLTELAKKTGLSINIVSYRLKQLEKNKIILGYKYALNSKLLGYETCKAIIALKNISEKRKKELINYCKLNPNVINCVQTIGPWDLEFEIEVKNFEQYYQIMNDIQEKFSDIIKSYDSVLFSSEPKQTFMPNID